MGQQAVGPAWFDLQWWQSILTTSSHSRAICPIAFGCQMQQRKWVMQRDAASHFCISERSLIRLRRDGVLAPGCCWVRKVPTNMNSHVIYDLEACESALSKATIAARIEKDTLGMQQMHCLS